MSILVQPILVLDKDHLSIVQHASAKFLLILMDQTYRPAVVLVVVLQRERVIHC